MRTFVPWTVRRWLKIQPQRLTRWPPIGCVRFGSLRRLKPISQFFGFDRGQCIDRYYIEKFLAHYASDIKGYVLEIGDDIYTNKFGGNRVIKNEVLHVVKGNPKATIVADLTHSEHLPSETFDCIIFTQTLQFIYDVETAVRTLYRLLKPDGVVLATLPGISPISRYDMDRWGDFWRFTTLSACLLFKEIFSEKSITIQAYGNVLVATAFLHGLAAHELKKRELDNFDPNYEILITVRALKKTK